MSAVSVTIAPLLCSVWIGEIMSMMISLFHGAPLIVHVGERQRCSVAKALVFSARMYARNRAARSAFVSIVCVTRPYFEGVWSIGRSTGWMTRERSDDSEELALDDDDDV